MYRILESSGVEFRYGVGCFMILSRVNPPIVLLINISKCLNGCNFLIRRPRGLINSANASIYATLLTFNLAENYRSALAGLAVDCPVWPTAQRRGAQAGNANAE